MGNHWKSFSSFHASLNAWPCLLNADARTRAAEDLVRALCCMEMRFMLLKPSRPACRPAESCSLFAGLFFFSTISLLLCATYSCAGTLKGLLRQPQTLTPDKTVTPWACRQQPRNPFILSSGASLVLEHVFLWVQPYKRFHILLSVKPQHIPLRTSSCPCPAAPSTSSSPWKSQCPRVSIPEYMALLNGPMRHCVNH